MQRTEDDYLSLEEVSAKLSHLSGPDLLRLHRVAQYQANKLRGCDPEELLSEGLKRVVSGDRRWPRGLDLAPFLKNVFASIVSSNAKHAALVARYSSDAEVDGSGDVDLAPGDYREGLDVDSSDGIYAQEMLERVSADLVDDPKALAVAMALGEGLTADETQSRFRLSKNDYDASRKRLRRVINRIVAEEKVA